MKSLFAYARAALLLTWHPQVRAVACRGTVTSDITLTAGLHCKSGWLALYVPTTRVTIRLNGHALNATDALQASRCSMPHMSHLGPARLPASWRG